MENVLETFKDLLPRRKAIPMTATERERNKRIQIFQSAARRIGDAVQSEDWEQASELNAGLGAILNMWRTQEENNRVIQEIEEY